MKIINVLVSIKKCQHNMERIEIKVANYYGNPSYYSVMPQALFDLLEAATLNGEEYILADKAQVEQMVAGYKIKMEQWEKSNS